MAVKSILSKVVMNSKEQSIALAILPLNLSLKFMKIVTHNKNHLIKNKKDNTGFNMLVLTFWIWLYGALVRFVTSQYKFN